MEKGLSLIEIQCYSFLYGPYSIRPTYHSEGESKGEFLDQMMILSFDVNNDKFGEMALPDGDRLHKQSLFVYKVNLAFITYGYPEKDDGLQSDSQCFILGNEGLWCT